MTLSNNILKVQHSHTLYRTKIMLFLGLIIKYCKIYMYLHKYIVLVVVVLNCLISRKLF